jgi:flavin-dependent dehydrogenase
MRISYQMGSGLAPKGCNVEYYDAIVIGAGPAGCSAARALTHDGFKTLLLERERLPREKTCGGVVSAEALARVEQRFGPLPRG